ncbi:MAG: hypothetical protein ACRDTH_03875, partial [Pseudonocardiaceae bacterium]
MGRGGEGGELCFQRRIGWGLGCGTRVGVGEGEQVGVVGQPVGVWWWPPVGSRAHRVAVGGRLGGLVGVGQLCVAQPL